MKNNNFKKIPKKNKAEGKGIKKKLTVVTCVVSTGMRTNCGRVWVWVWLEGGGGKRGTWGNETPPDGLAGTARTGVKTGEKKTKTEDAVAERRTCFVEDEQSKCNQTGKKKQDGKRSENSAKDKQEEGTSSKQKHRSVHLKENKR